VSNDKKASELSDALKSCRGAFLGVGLFSGAINLLTLTGSLFMLQVYDRVLPSRSLPTLVALTVLVAVLYAFQGLFEAIRMRVLARIGRTLDDRLSGQVYVAIAKLPLKAPSGSAGGLQPIHDLDSVRTFLSGMGPTALFDLPWMPLYLALCFAFHLWIGVAALCGALILIALTISTEALTRQPSRAASPFAVQRLTLAEASRRGAEAIQAMGMRTRMAKVWSASNTKYMDLQQSASDIAGGLGSASRIMRMFLQSGILAVGAWLVIIQEASPGVIIASSILVSRALAPVEIAIANWKGFLGARQSWRRLSELLALTDASTPATTLPPPQANLSLEAVSVAPPGRPTLVVHDVTLKLTAGQGLGIIGPSASGKSSLARAIVGTWTPARGAVRLDGAALDQWTSETLGPHIGYLPQDVELFDGTIAQNIARFHDPIDSEAVIAAARLAGVHELILRLTEGYETRVGEAGAALSGGQRQRVALARALYGNPFLVVLDEPNSNLDVEGEKALTDAVMSVRKRGGIVIVIAHRPSALAAVDQVLVLANGRAQAVGPKNEVMQKVLDPAAGAARGPVLKAEGRAG
jgi:PrtD family type I secretion system ABC transporter